MKIKTIKFTKSIRTKDGEERVEAYAQLGNSDNPDVTFNDLKNFVEEKLGLKSEQMPFRNMPFESIKNIEGFKFEEDKRALEEEKAREQTSQTFKTIFKTR